MSPDLLQIGEFAKRAGTNLRTLRYYEELDLITPASRSSGGFRFYDVHQLDRIEAIKRLQQLGLSLKEIQQLMTPMNGASGPEVAARAERILGRQRQLVEQRISGLQRDLRDLDTALQRLQTCKKCDTTLSVEECDPCSTDRQAIPPVIKALL